MVGSSSLSSSLGGRRGFRRLIREANEIHRPFSMITYEARQLVLALDTTKVTLATLEGETTAAQVVAADVQT